MSAAPLDPRAAVYELYSAGGLAAGGEKNARRAPNAYVTHFATCPDSNRFSGGAAAPSVEIDDLRERLKKALDEVAVLKERLKRKDGGQLAFGAPGDPS